MKKFFMIVLVGFLCFGGLFGSEYSNKPIRLYNDLGIEYEISNNLKNYSYHLNCGEYKPIEDKIYLKKFNFWTMPAPNYRRVVLHELGHWTGAIHRLNRTDLFVDDIFLEEYIASEVAIRLSSHFQIRIDDSSYNLLRRRHDFRVLNKRDLDFVYDESDKALLYILDSLRHNKTMHSSP